MLLPGIGLRHLGPPMLLTSLAASMPSIEVYAPLRNTRLGVATASIPFTVVTVLSVQSFAVDLPHCILKFENNVPVRT